MPSPSLDSATSNAALAPLERVLLPAELDGRHGANRARGVRAQIAADRDIDAIKGWLARFADVKTTFDSYRKEAERLLLWSTVELRKPLSSLTHEDLLAYQRFLADPQPALRSGKPFDMSWRSPTWTAVMGTAATRPTIASLCSAGASIT